MKTPAKILIVDDEETICEALKAWFVKDGYRADTAGSGEEALDCLEEKEYDVFLVDIKMPGMDGIELLSRIREKLPDASVIMITAHGSVQTAVEAMKKGATDYLCKPFDPDELSLLMERVMANKALYDENVALREQLAEREASICEGFVIHSEAMRGIFAQIKEVGPSSAPVLITGETGTGKDLVARALHLHSERAYGPFVTINCGALSESLLESELYGHERGAFTGAVKARRGRLEMANGGTLFMDEIGEISLKTQVSLLRALEDKSCRRLGGSETINTDFRLVSATHRDLSVLVREGVFREDFFYRVNVISMRIPPLRERLEDVPVLADYFLKKYVEETGKRLESFTQRALGLLTTYSWPGNVRELRNVVERAVVISRGRMIGAEELSFLNPGGEECFMGPMTLRAVEISHIKATLEACGWNISRASNILGIDRSTLARKMKRHEIARR